MNSVQLCGRLTRDICGERAGCLVAIAAVYSTGNGLKWLWRCDCGNLRVAFPHSARETGHCGCKSRERFAARSRKHGAHGTPAYRCWDAMKQRCSNPKNHAYPYYGGRGIAVCQRWSESFAAFLADMGQPPPGMTIERIDNNRGYEPGNCRWATRREQQGNRRVNIMVQVANDTVCLAEACRRLGVNYNGVRSAMRSGMTPQAALHRLKLRSKPRDERPEPALASNDYGGAPADETVPF